MQTSAERTRFSASDLSVFYECEFRTLLDLAVLGGELTRPHNNELERRLLEKRGHDHEARVLTHYRAQGLEITSITTPPGSDRAAQLAAQAATEAAMARGAEVIYQAFLMHGDWLGRPDFLLKIPGKSKFGDYAYEVVDAKLAHSAKARAILQLCAYTDHLQQLQASAPDHFWIVPHAAEIQPLRLRSADYLAYYRLARDRFEGFVKVAQDAQSPNRCYPEPVEHCNVCNWWKRCEDRRRSDDHLSLVAGITKRQRERLSHAGTQQVAALAALPNNTRVQGMNLQTFERIHQQASLQVRGRTSGTPVYELLLDPEPGAGLERLPHPTPGDLFLDIEGDPFVHGQGLEYLFGLLELGQPDSDFLPRTAPGAPRYLSHWAHNSAEEKRAFEAVIDRIIKGREEFALLHVYHFGHRETDALKQLSCRHHTREEAVDQLLRDHVFVDLYPIVRHSLRASVEGYTLKQLERFYGYQRQAELRAAAHAMQLFGYYLETRGHTQELQETQEFYELIALYNQDDCHSTWKLRDWLEARRLEFADRTGRMPARPAPPTPTTSDKRQARSAETQALAARLVAGLAEDANSDTPPEQARRLLAALLDWHWREAKSSYWEFYRALEVVPSERVEDRGVLGGIRYDREIAEEKQSKLYRYEFPEQEHNIRSKPEPIDPDTQKSPGVLVELGPMFLHLKRSKRQPPPALNALVAGRPIDSPDQARRLLALGYSIANLGLDDRSEYAAARDLLLRNPPRVSQTHGEKLLQPGEDSVAAIKRLALQLDRSVLAVQGPPGAGKTFAAAEMIIELVRQGRRVGITANSHKVILNLLERVQHRAKLQNVNLTALHMGDAEEAAADSKDLLFSKDYPQIKQQLLNAELHVLGGTAWAFSRAEFEQALDVLVVDEAGQMALANVLAVSGAAQNLILFGDPAQLDQPQKGVHPPGADQSALEYLLADAATIPEHLGIFLPQTRRLHPKICEFTSRVFYEGRLTALAGLDTQHVDAPGQLAGAGLRFLAVEHHGNTSRSDEEAEEIEKLVNTLLHSGASFTDQHGNKHDLSAEHILVVAPYNSQVAALRQRLPAALRVGTVDKFQGQEAPIVIYSMTSSSAEDAPRGLEFLFSLNRLNVATSRAQALVILVASPTLARVRCKTPRQMRLANAFCSYLELAQQLAKT